MSFAQINQISTYSIFSSIYIYFVVVVVVGFFCLLFLFAFTADSDVLHGNLGVLEFFLAMS